MWSAGACSRFLFDGACPVGLARLTGLARAAFMLAVTAHRFDAYSWRSAGSRRTVRHTTARRSWLQNARANSRTPRRGSLGNAVDSCRHEKTKIPNSIAARKRPPGATVGCRCCGRVRSATKHRNVRQRAERPGPADSAASAELANNSTANASTAHGCRAGNANSSIRRRRCVRGAAQ
jgi:hypothetical protein